ncbi:hypothetical protein [Alicyclobacillus fastidiosus]|uniref:Uncharacterized protein n=1 Tax=Alicyclobacillus fastidiosus TaxID=392011 RepID=A0ABV5AI13_9BACL|nr:hypothetical protein [Alicyclobacillus fastidiosus]WEH10089.1 hypothetical protein PYS47_02060 [Alicyclobacillus fastidiosus]
MKYSKTKALETVSKLLEIFNRHPEIIQIVVQGQAWGYVQDGIEFELYVSTEDAQEILMNFYEDMFELRLMGDEAVVCNPDLNKLHMLNLESTFLNEVFRWILVDGFSPRVKCTGVEVAPYPNQIAFKLTVYLFEQVPDTFPLRTKLNEDSFTRKIM